ncbi:MAG: hypothetical protein ABW250_20485 [Pyrinomonadaceae bacterium]
MATRKSKPGSAAAKTSTSKTTAERRAGAKKQTDLVARKGAAKPRRAPVVRPERPAPPPKPPASEPAVQIQLRTQSGPIVTFTSGQALKRAAMQWTYVLRNRRRWNTSEEARKEQALRTQNQLEAIGITKEHLKRIAEFEVVEVGIPYTAETEGWEARIFPWEYMLSAATDELRGEKPLTVIRHLERQGTQPPKRRKKIERVLIVESAPGGLRKLYTFDSERDLVKAGLELTKPELSVDETRQQLSRRISAYAPDVIHLAGCDNNQSFALNIIQDGAVHDGYLLKADSEGLDPVKFTDLALILNAAPQKPALVTCNLYYTAARVCPLIVAEGAGAAIGFQDEFDDALTELFLSNFYEAWRRFKWDILEAFKFACNVLRNQPRRLTGTGIVLWSDKSLVKPQSQDSRDVKTSLLKEREKVITLDDVPEGDIRNLLSVDLKTCPNLNYSMLHNDCDVFEKFILRKEMAGRVKDICVNVVLFLGGESSTFTSSVDMVESRLDLNRHIRVPLLYSIELLNNENIHTSLFVEVTWQKHLLHRQTYRVTLPPLDEWRGNDTERVWLPSFILPRDPAVGKIVENAQNYVMALRDDSRAGFDGYQCIGLDPTADNPVECVDQQVKALWAALVYNMSLSYINPPPTYHLTAQRLRTPTEIVGGRRGTCIDLALLFAACLEYVDIYPVIFLLKNHALPGFWRSSRYQDDFKKIAVKFQTPVTPTGEEQSDVSTVQRWPWYHSKNAYEEIMQEVNNDRLYPLETVGLTQHQSYRDSVAEGIAKLINENQQEQFAFEGMIDVTQARNSLITPIPRR